MSVASHTPARCSKRLNVAAVRDVIASRAAKAACPAGTGSAIAVASRSRRANGERSGTNGRTERATTTSSVAIATAARKPSGAFTVAGANWRPNLTDLKIGWESYGGGGNDTLWFDDVVLSTARIGCS